jgi:xylulokinase
VVYADDGFTTAARPDDAFARAEAVARAAGDAAPANDGVRFYPWLTGSMAPAPDDHVRGGFTGMGLETTRAAMTRAVYDGVALNAAWLFEPFQAFTGVQYDEITFGGGAARSALWGDLLAAALGITVHRLAEPELTNARGAALLAFSVLGHGEPEAGAPVRVEQTHQATPAAIARAAKAREHFGAYHAATRAWHHAFVR